MSGTVRGHVPGRPRRERRLFATPGVRATLVVAPAGWGKTSLAASWVRGGVGGRTAAWVRLGARHDDVVAFWTALAEALAPAAGPVAGAALRRSLDGGVRPDELPAAVTTAVGRAAGPVLLVLDDLHRVTSPQVHDGLVHLVERSPRTLSLLVLSRRDPPWPLVRLRLAGLLAGIGAEELALGPDEAAGLLARAGVELPGPLRTELVARSEGWAAGLRLAAPRLRAARDPAAAVAGFPGDDPAVVRYLDSEVLAGLSPELLEFLRSISVVDPVCPGLADALTGRGGGERLLAGLVAAHLVGPVAHGPGRWYHLHRPVADTARARIGRRERRDLQRRAVGWLRGDGRPSEAVRVAVLARIWPLAADLVGRYGAAWLPGGPAPELREVLLTVPRGALAAHPELACAVAGARLAAGDREVADLLDGARSGLGRLPRARAARCRVLLDLLTAALSGARGDWDTAARVARGVPADPLTLARLGIAETAPVTAVVDDLRGVAALLRGERVRAERHLSAVLSSGPGTPAPVRVDAAAHLSLLQGERGELVTARATALRTVSRAVEAGLDRSPQAAGAYLALAAVALDRLDLDEVDTCLDRVDELGGDAPARHVHAVAALLRAGRREAAGRPAAALRALRAAAPAVRPRTLPPALRERWLTAEAGLLGVLGRVHAARALLAELAEPSPQALIGSARVLLALGDVGPAVAARRAVDPDDPRGRTDAALLDVALAVRAGDQDTALQRLESALVVAARAGLRRPFRTAPVDLRALLERRLRLGTAVPHFAVDLLERAGGVPSAVGGPRAPVERLSARQHTVLRYLASTLSNAEIAAALSVSVNTVKTHERAVYRKLAVANRQEAVVRAQAQGLL